MNSVLAGTRNAINNWLRQFKTFINFEDNTYKIQESLMGVFKWGEFKPLPKLNYVLVFKNVFAKCETCSIDEFENNPHAYFQVSLVHNSNRRIIVHETKNKEEAFKIAEQLGNNLHLRIKDSSSRRQSVWLG
ncbi:MAG TPA: hypothetical protein PLC65_16600 [Bacteroidia bacterium]|nr:hypothetical protein [Bacteroidia bacterium]HRD40249.1 hypothetical protein [Bacteroidia bacterium]